MKINLKKGFTLVELLVTITILIILGTIGFNSYQGYVVNSRDTVRISDLSNIKTVLEHSKIDLGRYVEPDNGVFITFSGGIIWTQGIFGDKSVRGTKRLDKAPKDPLFGVNYTFSVTKKGDEYQLGSIVEGEKLSVLSNQNLTFAENGRIFTANIIGNYNGQIATISTGGLDYVLAIPSIISTEKISLDIKILINNRKLVLNNYNNIPSSYGIDYTPLNDNDVNFVNSDKIVVFSGNIKKLEKSISDRIHFLNNLKLAYYGTLSIVNSRIENITSIDIDILDPSKKAKNLVAKIINNKFIKSENKKIKIMD